MKLEYTIDELKECIREALENWDFDVCSDFPRGEYRKAALEHAYRHPELLCEDGIFVIGGGYTDIWNALSEFAQSSGANIAIRKCKAI